MGYNPAPSIMLRIDSKCDVIVAGFSSGDLRELGLPYRSEEEDSEACGKGQNENN